MALVAGERCALAGVRVAWEAWIVADRFAASANALLANRAVGRADAVLTGVAIVARYVDTQTGRRVAGSTEIGAIRLATTVDAVLAGGAVGNARAVPAGEAGITGEWRALARRSVAGHAGVGALRLTDATNALLAIRARRDARAVATLLTWPTTALTLSGGGVADQALTGRAVRDTLPVLAGLAGGARVATLTRALVAGLAWTASAAALSGGEVTDLARTTCPGLADTLAAFLAGRAGNGCA
jgi:hypothetical protein